jgi:TrmH family RNA methyltransferase
MSLHGEPIHISSRDNAFVKALRALTESARARRESQMALLDGAHLVEAARAAAVIADTVAASESGLARPEVRRLFEAMPARRRLVLTDRIFEQTSPLASPTGLLATVPVPADPGLPARLGDAVYLDGVQDTGNVGTILRTCAAAGVHQVLAGDKTAFFWSPKVIRAGQGAHFGLQLHEGVTPAAAFAAASAQVLVARGEGDTDLYDLDLTGPTLWVFGNEGAGVGEVVRALPHRAVRLPMAAGVESLNVAVAAAVCLYEQVRQRRGRKPRQKAR